MALFVYEIDGRPPLLLPAVPVHALLIQQYGIGDAQPLRLADDVGRDLLRLRLRGMHADDGQVFLRKSLLPSAVTRQVPFAVDSAERPEVEDVDAPFAQLQLLAAGVQPVLRLPDEFRGWKIEGHRPPQS